jgi:hypothetical protein
MNIKLFLLFFLLLKGILLTNCEFFSSTDDLTKLLHNKAETIEQLKEFIESLEKESERLKR